MASTEKIEGRVIEEVSLIDILYKDEYRIDSYLAQIMKGVLRRRKIQETNSQTDKKEMSGSIKILSGILSEGGTETIMEETRFVPHDRNVNDLLDILDLEPQEILTDNDAIGRLVCLKGRLAIRDFKKFIEIINVMAENSELFPIAQEEIIKAKKAFNAFSKIIPMNVETEIILKDNGIVRGILQEKYLLTAYPDIVATHGTRLPGVWFTVGILDSLEKVSSIKSPIPQGFRKGMDVFSDVTETLYREGNSKYVITPFLIFRGLEK